MAIYVYTNQRDGGIAHIPSSSEFEDLKSIMDGLSLTTGEGYRTKLHMPYAGSRYPTTTDLQDQGVWGRYYSSSRANGARAIIFNSSRVYVTPTTPSSAGSVRCFYETYIVPDNTRTVEYGTLGSAGIFHNATLGVISVTNGTDKSITMYDKNVGATTVYNDGDTLTESNMGKMFQWGNYYGFPSTGSVSPTSSTQVDTTGYGGSNPYSSSTFITMYGDWSNPSNDNLRTDSKEEYFVIE